MYNVHYTVEKRGARTLYSELLKYMRDCGLFPAPSRRDAANKFAFHSGWEVRGGGARYQSPWWGEPCFLPSHSSSQKTMPSPPFRCLRLKITCKPTTTMHIFMTKVHEKAWNFLHAQTEYLWFLRPRKQVLWYKKIDLAELFKVFKFLR